MLTGYTEFSLSSDHGILSIVSYLEQNMPSAAPCKKVMVSYTHSDAETINFVYHRLGLVSHIDVCSPRSLHAARRPHHHNSATKPPTTCMCVSAALTLAEILPDAPTRQYGRVGPQIGRVHFVSLFIRG
jgi:hypothetical protein